MPIPAKIRARINNTAATASKYARPLPAFALRGQAHPADDAALAVEIHRMGLALVVGVPGDIERQKQLRPVQGFVLGAEAKVAEVLRACRLATFRGGGFIQVGLGQRPGAFGRQVGDAQDRAFDLFRLVSRRLVELVLPDQFEQALPVR